MRSFHDLTRDELEALLAPHSPDATSLARHLFREVYREHRGRWSDVRSVTPRVLNVLERELDLALPPVTDAQRSSDSSEKFVVSFTDGLTAEAVLMPWGGRRVRSRDLARSFGKRARRVPLWQVVKNLRARDVVARLYDHFGPKKDLTSVCLSTQVGCAMGCTFCFTGTRGLKRNLSAGEIVQQLVQLRRVAPIGGIVFMGMGEPLHNLDNLLRALRIIQDPEGIAMSGDRIHVSTSGLVSGIDSLASTVDVRLALSLNATTDAIRSQVMPVNDRWPIADVIAACHRYVARSRGPIMVEYVLLAGVNDTPDDAARLVSLLSGLDSTVQLIPFNEFAGAPFRRPEPSAIAAFRRALDAAGVPHTIRFSKASDVAGACGQLGLSVEEGRGARKAKRLVIAD